MSDDNQNQNTRVFLINTVTRIVRESTGLHEQFSCSIAKSVVDELSRQFGCDKLYIPALPREEKRATVLKEFNGQNADELMAKHNISSSTFYRWLNAR